ncbi:hypothetical protein [Nocardioides sp. B-3]|uniref:hypothetical protein n=1 Tax=Nocardioides sp. B-3 TaxID=2895565 RepID=UPI00300DFAB4
MSTVTHYDVPVIGSRFGGSVTALRLTEKGYKVGVLEAGARFTDEDLPENGGDAKRFIFQPQLGMYGIQRIDIVNDCFIPAGAGVGGGSPGLRQHALRAARAVLHGSCVVAHHGLEVRAVALLRPRRSGCSEWWNTPRRLRPTWP